MLKQLATGICAFAMLFNPVAAQTSCAPDKLAQAIDRYGADPFGPRSWRMLKGLGDPMVDAESRGADYWSAQETWQKLVTEIAPDAKYLRSFGYDCRVGYPLQVLQQRIASLTATDPYVKQWLRAQDAVMQSCTEASASEVRLPEQIEVKPELAQLQRDDRAYQEATIAFYRDKPKAVALFRAIATAGGPHRASAHYNVANLLANGKQLTEARAEAKAILADPSKASVHAITRELLGYIANLEDTAPGWAELINSTTAVIEQPTTKILSNNESRSEYAYALSDVDYAGVGAKKDDWWLDGKLPENPTLSKALVDTARSSPMVLWMMAGKSANQYGALAPWSMMGDRWQARLDEMTAKALSLPSAAGIPEVARDMLLAVSAKADDESRQALWQKAKAAVAAAETTCGEDGKTAAAALLLSNAVRVSAAAGQFEEAYAGLSALPIKTSDAYVEGAVLKLGEFLLGQGNLAEARRYRDRLLAPGFLRGMPDGQRQLYADSFTSQLLWMAESEEKWREALAAHGRKTSHQLLNFLPIKKLRELAEDSLFNPDERALLARAAWTREYALGRKITAEATAQMMKLNPQLQAQADKVKADYPLAGPERAQLLTILRNPRYGILVTAPDLYEPIEMPRSDFTEIDSWDVNDKNWWCPFEPDRQLGGLRSEYDQVSRLNNLQSGDEWIRRRLQPVLDEKLLTALAAKRDTAMKAHPMVRAAAWKELAALAAAPSGPRKLSEAAVRWWGKVSQGEDGQPEALALAVRTTRYGCRWHGRHGAYSKAAQELLKEKFKDSSWAKATPYWFDCMNYVWDKDYNKVADCKPRAWKKQPPLN